MSGNPFVLELVQTVRDEEVGYFIKRGVYEVVPRGHELSTGWKLVGTVYGWTQTREMPRVLVAGPDW